MAEMQRQVTKKANENVGHTILQGTAKVFSCKWSSFKITPYPVAESSARLHGSSTWQVHGSEQDRDGRRIIETTV